MPHVFQQINQRLGPLEVDLFAMQLTAQLTTYVSWRPDLLASATNAFTNDWSQLRGYANPPWNLIGKILSQACRQQAELVLVAPAWRAQPWYPILLKMLVDFPLLIPPRSDLIQLTYQINQPDVLPQLAVWVISGNNTKGASFRERQLTSYCPLEDRSPQRCTNV